MNPHDAPEDALEGREVESTALVALVSKAEIDQQIATAHKYPRSISSFRKEALQMVTLSEVIAGECMYALMRKDGNEKKVIEGPSARFAEIMLHAWGNARAGARVVHEDAEFVTSQGVCHDLQRNVAITFEVRRRITTKEGKRYSADMIAVTANAASSIALRNAILKVVPKAFWSELYTAARKTAIGDVKTLANKRADAIASFQHYGITEEQVLRRLGREGIQDMTIDDLAILLGISTAIKENEITPEEAFSEDDTGRAPPREPQARKPTPETTDGRASDEPEGEHKQEAKSGELMPRADAPQAPKEKSMPATEGDLKLIRKKMDEATVTEKELCKKFGIKALDASHVDTDLVRVILTWLKNPGE